MKNSVGGAAHSDIETHGIFKGLKVGDVAWQNALVVVSVVAFAEIDHYAPCSQE